MPTTSNNKVKGLLKGLRYISQIFDNEKEREMKIGNPTDVKHVAHIGYDGPSESSPSWMNDFTNIPGAPPEVKAALHNVKSSREQHNVNADMLTSQGSRGKTSKSANYLDRDLPDIPKSSRRQPIGEFMDSPTRDKPRRPRQKKSSKNKTTSDGSRQSRNSMASDLGEGSESPARNLPDIPKKSTRKTSKEVSSGGSRDSVKPRLRSQNLHLGAESPSHSMTKSRNKQRSLDEDADREKGNGREISQVLM